MDRDAVSLVILALHRMVVLGKRLFDRLHALAEAYSIPIIDQYGHILGQSAEPEEVEQTHDQHWNAPAADGRRKWCLTSSDATRRFAAWETARLRPRELSKSLYPRI